MQFKLQKVGFITKPHGFKGHLQVKLEKELKNNWFKEPIFLEIQEQSVPFFIEEFAKKNNGNIVIKIKDCSTEQDALKFKGQSISVKEELIIEQSNFFSLIGWKIMDQASGRLGVIEEVIKNPQQQLLRISIDEKEALVPLAEEFIVSVDSKNNIVTFNLPEGLLDIYL